MKQRHLWDVPVQYKSFRSLINNDKLGKSVDGVVVYIHDPEEDRPGQFGVRYANIYPEEYDDREIENIFWDVESNKTLLRTETKIVTRVYLKRKENSHESKNPHTDHHLHRLLQRRSRIQAQTLQERSVWRSTAEEKPRSSE